MNSFLSLLNYLGPLPMNALTLPAGQTTTLENCYATFTPPNCLYYLHPLFFSRVLLRRAWLKCGHLPIWCGCKKWHGTRSELPFLNSLKMKMSTLLGVAQMNLGSY